MFGKKKEVKIQINDLHNILELVKQDILRSEAEYLKLLKVVGNNHRYDIYFFTINNIVKGKIKRRFC